MSKCRFNGDLPVFRAPFLTISIIIIVCVIIIVSYDTIKRAKHGVREIQNKQYQCFSTETENIQYFQNELLRPLLIERVAGTVGSARAREHILSKLRSTNLWDIELDTFDDQTPDGMVEFTNIIATLNPTANRRLVLACHYDSKKMKNFVGATDSAVPCAILLDIAINLRDKLSELKLNKDNPTLQLIFFDGEEAFRQWTDADSLYGSRHLANKMRHSYVPGRTDLNQIDAIDLFVLLDLIGHTNVRFSNFFDMTTGKYYNRLMSIERRLLDSYSGNSQKKAVFTSTINPGYIQDDHIPFLQQNVPILHLISYPFPPTWHTPDDNEANLDFSSIRHIRNTLRIFVIEYLHLDPRIC